jgi:HEAT repeat protein
VHTLGALLGDPEPLVRRVAVGALGEIGGKIAIGYLRQLRYDPDESIRASANAILREEALGAD